MAPATTDMLHEMLGHLWQEVIHCNERQADAAGSERLHRSPVDGMKGGEIISLDPGDSEEYSITYWKFLFCSAVTGIESALAAYHNPKGSGYHNAVELVEQLQWAHRMLRAVAGTLAGYQRRPSWKTHWSSLYEDVRTIESNLKKCIALLPA